MSVPKIIHCCWLSGEPKDALTRRCLDSWRRFAPDYEIREWDLSALRAAGVTIPFFVQEALARRRWAFAADWVRFLALKAEGGVYLDCDLELVAPIDDLVAHGAFVGGQWMPNGSVHLEPAVMALEKDSPVAAAMLARYAGESFDGKTTVCDLLADTLRTLRPEPALTRLSPEVFSPYDVCGHDRRTAATRGIHHAAMSWASPQRKLAKWLSWHGLRGVVEAGLWVKHRLEGR